MGLVDQIIAAKKQYDETDRPWLSKLADSQLKKIAVSCGCSAEGDAGATPPKEPVAAAATPEPTPAVTPPVEAPQAAAAPVAAAAAAPEKPPTAEEWIEQAPENIRGLLGDLLAQRRARESELREQIVAQSRGEIKAEYLANKPLDELEVLCRATRQPDYTGRGVQGADPVAQAGKAPTAPRMPGIKIGGSAAAA